MNLKKKRKNRKNLMRREKRMKKKERKILMQNIQCLKIGFVLDYSL